MVVFRVMGSKKQRHREKGVERSISSPNQRTFLWGNPLLSRIVKSIRPWSDKVYDILDGPITRLFMQLLLAAFAASGRLSMSLSNFLLAAAFFVGCFGIYRSGKGIRSSIIPCLLLGIILTSISWWIQPNSPRPKQSTDAGKVVQQLEQSADHKPKLPITTVELAQNLREQIQFLQRSSAYFDQGVESEAKRISSSLHILFSGIKDGPSLLGQLRIQDELLLPDTAWGDPEGNLMPYSGLVGFGPDGGGMKWKAKCQTPQFGNFSLFDLQDTVPRPPAPLSDLPKFIPFEKWWHEIIINDRKGHVFTRESLVSAVSEQDGGIEVASNLDSAYVELARKNAMGWRTPEGKPLSGVELASIRQIGWETLEALRKLYPQFFPE
jgi:hypothetical protein